MSEFTLPTPPGYVGVEWADGAVHALDPKDQILFQALWRVIPVCGRAGPGVSSDEAGPDLLDRPVLTCVDCIGILGGHVATDGIVLPTNALQAITEALLPLVALDGDYTDVEPDDAERLVEAVLEGLGVDGPGLLAMPAGTCPICQRPFRVKAMHGYTLHGKRCPELI